MSTSTKNSKGLFAEAQERKTLKILMSLSIHEINHLDGEFRLSETYDTKRKKIAGIMTCIYQTTGISESMRKTLDKEFSVKETRT